MLRNSKRESRVKVVGFDEDPLTLWGISEGVVTSTVVQQPFEFGYQSMVSMVRYLSGDRSFIPPNKQIIVPTRVIDQSNVAGFQTAMREMMRAR